VTSDETELPNELRDMGTIEAILKNDSGIAQNSRHAPKRVTPGESIETKGAVLKKESLAKIIWVVHVWQKTKVSSRNQRVR
jgi:hypothetical protein